MVLTAYSECAILVSYLIPSRGGMAWTVDIHPDVMKFIGKYLSPDDKVLVLELFDRLEIHGTNLGRPYTRQIEGKLWELRPQTTQGTWRFLYIAAPEQRFFLVVGMRKRKRITEEMKRTAYNRLSFFEEGG